MGNNLRLSATIMEKAMRLRDTAYDGAFFVAVRTTSIFCRPSCPARKPLRQNTVFYPTAKAAIFAGYRPCKRCRPLDTDGRPPKWVETLLERVEADPHARMRDADLRSMGIDPVRARRYFQNRFGMTFQAYCRGRRLGTALQRIREGQSLDDVILDHGFESHSGFRDAFRKTHGKAPGASRDANCVGTKLLESPLGPIVIGATPEGACLLEFSDRRMLEAQFETLRQRFQCAIVPGENEHLQQLERELTSYFEGTLQDFKTPLVFPGTPFQVRVWNALRRIPYGETRSYEELGRSIKLTSGWRAVGHANGQNRLAIIIPCHRVIRKGGHLGGYGGGLWRKEWLLSHEEAHASKDVRKTRQLPLLEPLSR